MVLLQRLDTKEPYRIAALTEVSVASLASDDHCTCSNSLSTKVDAASAEQ